MTEQRRTRTRKRQPAWQKFAAAGIVVLLLVAGGIFFLRQGQPAPSITLSLPSGSAEAAVAGDPVVAALSKIGSDAGELKKTAVYSKGQFVRQGGQYLFAWKDGATTANGLEPVPIVTREETVFDDRFTDGFGPVDPTTPRSIPDSTSQMSFTGAGYRDVFVGPGSMSAAGNTYFVVENLPEGISEFGSVVQLANATGVATMAMQTLGFSEMWHVNSYPSGAGDTTYWLNGAAALVPKFKYSWNSGAKLDVGKPQEIVLRIRGNFIFGYIRGELAFVQLHDQIGTIAAKANSIYVQNHAAARGDEQQLRLWVKHKL